MILQLLILVALVAYIVFNSINFMDQYSDEAKENFNNNRNWHIAISIIVFAILYFAGTFDKLF